MTATQGDITVVTPISSFTTVEVIPPVPVYICPGVGQSVLYANDVVRFEPVEGPGSLRVQISTSETFPARTSYSGTIEGAFETIPLSLIRGAGRLVDGNTYYVRARYAYRTLATGTTPVFTDYCDIRSFVYRELVRGDVNGDGEMNIADVNAVIDMILSDVSDVYTLGDVNGDGEVNIADVNVVIDLILK